jgi:hypothetical protein
LLFFPTKAPDVITATAARRKRMATFTIDNENNITAYRPGDAMPEGDAERFASEKELGELAAQWPAARLQRT